MYNKTSLRCLSIIFVFFLSIRAYSQKDLYSDAEEKFSNENYPGALKNYLLLMQKDSENIQITYNIGVCYLYSIGDKTKGIPYLEKMVRLEEKHFPDAVYLLARAYHYNYQFNEAIRMYNKFKKRGRGKKQYLKEVDRQIQYCMDARELVKFPLDVTFENLGKNINSPFPDYFPFVPVDEAFLVYNSRRPQGSYVEDDGSYTAGIYISQVEDGVFTKSKILGSSINTSEGDEEVIGLSSDGNIMLLYFDNAVGVGDIYMSYADKRGHFKAVEVLGKNINSEAEEISASINTDGSIMYFASDRKGGFGGMDIYMSRKLPTGAWGPAKNMGDVINTAEDEDFPNISPDGKTLYFSSKGHVNMGGYDIFTVEWDETTKAWQRIKNLGYPINTPDDNMNFKVSETGRYGYISAQRNDGLGDFDIYRVTLNNIEPSYTVIMGKISSTDSLKKINYSDMEITLTDKKDENMYGTYLPNPNTGRYVVIAPSGNYNLTVENKGYESFSEDIVILDKSSFQTEIEKSIKLIPQPVKPAIPPKRIKK